MATLTNQARDLLLGADNDLVVDRDLQLSRGLSGITQACRIAVQIFQEEWFLNLDVGIPYFQSILAQRSPVAALLARKAFRDELLAIKGVTSITRLDTTFDSIARRLTISWVVGTDFGNTPADSIALSSAGGVL